MAQHSCDYWSNILSNPSYVEHRCHKTQFRPRKSYVGDYQIEDDVWARHPSDGFMYVASIISIDPLYHKCHVHLVADGSTFTVPLSDLRHVTVDDILLNRCVDYGAGWTERTRSGTFIKYDRYGDQQFPRYAQRSSNLFDYPVPQNEFNFGVHAMHASTPSSAQVTSTTSYNQHSTNEPIWVRIPDPEDPTATYSHCPIWNAFSYADAEKHALELCHDDTHYNEAVQRAQYRRDMCKQNVPLNVDTSNNSISNDHPQFIGLPSAESPNLTDSMSFALVDLPLLFSNTLDTMSQPEISIPTSKTSLAVKNCGTQTDSLISPSVIQTAITNRQLNVIHSHRSIKRHYGFTSNAKKTDTHPSKYRHFIFSTLSSKITSVIDKSYARSSKNRFRRFSIYGFSKHLTFILLTFIITYYLSIGSSSLKNIQALPTTTSSKPIIGVTHSIAFVIFISGMLPSISGGPSRSSFERWHYPFTDP